MSFLVSITVVATYSPKWFHQTNIQWFYCSSLNQGSFHLTKLVRSPKIGLSTSNMIWTSCPFNWPNSFKLKAKHLVKSCVIRHVSCISPLVIVGPILGSHVSPVTCTLGWGCQLEVEGMAYDWYAKCGKVPSCPDAPTSLISYSTPINVPWHPWSHNFQGCIYPIVTSPPPPLAPP
jgi:hypothetical protein